MRDICDYIDENARYYIYGTGLLGQYCFRKIQERFGKGIILGYIHSTPVDRLLGGDDRVFSPEEAVHSGSDAHVILTGRNSVQEMRDICLSVGFDEKQLIVPEGIIPYLKTGYDKQVKDVCVWPPLKEKNTDLIKKLCWFIPDKIRIHIGIAGDMDAACLKENVEIHDAVTLEKKFNETDYILLWETSHSDALSDRYSGKVRVIDPYFYKSIDTINYDRLYFASLTDTEKEMLLKDSLSVFEKLISKAENKTRAAVLCTGPSISEIYEMPDEEFEDCFTVICNSMVKDIELMDKVHPAVVTFTDSNFFFSPSEYGEMFYKDLIAAVERYDLFVVVRDSQKPVLLHHFPQLKERVIGVPYKNKKPDEEYRFISQEFFYMQGLNNILLDLMIPIASTACDEIMIAGCTGRKAGETYFWEHNGRTQYLDLKQSVFDMWPSFFRYNSYEEYYEGHCKKVAGQLEYGETLGKKYLNITTSFIPALAERVKDA